MAKPIQIGNAQGFWGDQTGASARLVQQHPQLDYLTLDYLSEVSMSIMAIQKEKNPSHGFARDFIDVVNSLIPFWKQGSKVKVISNAGGLNPLGCGQACAELLRNKECTHLKIGIVSGDDVLALIKADPANTLFNNLETKESAKKIVDSMVTANAYLGAKSISDALLQGADIVITGRVADPSLTVGPCVAHYGWSWKDYHKLAGATVAGHLIECGTQVTGGISTQWLSLKDQANIGFPIVEIEENGDFTITKPEGTTGLVNAETVKEQLLYEIGDPANYLSPDTRVSFLSLKLEQTGKDRVKISGAEGSAPPNTYKVSATYRDGFKSEATLAIFGRDAYKKGKQCGNIVLEKLHQAGVDLQRSSIECIGGGDIVPGIVNQKDTKECLLRIAVADPREEALERFAKEIAPLVTSGPQGTTGYITGRPHIRPVFGYWPCLINEGSVVPKVQIIEVKKR